MAADTEQWARNRAIMAERLAWPDGTLEVVAAIEGMFTDYACYWSPGAPSRSQEGFYAMRKRVDSMRDGLIFGAVADDLIAGIQTDIARIEAEREAWRKAIPAWR